jgi:serine/threonine-protein kinase HipA
MDRTPSGPLHMEDFCQLTNKLTSQKYHGSMEQLGKALRQYSSVPGLDAVRLLELTLFCYLTGNSDMHLKNFSLIRLENGNYELTPAYDLVPVKIIMQADKEELALTMCGKKAKFKRGDFVNFSESLGLTTVQFERTATNLLRLSEQNLTETLNRSFLPEKMQDDFRTLFLERIGRFRGNGTYSFEKV